MPSGRNGEQQGPTSLLSDISIWNLEVLDWGSFQTADFRKVPGGWRGTWRAHASSVPKPHEEVLPWILRVPQANESKPKGLWGARFIASQKHATARGLWLASAVGGAEPSIYSVASSFKAESVRSELSQRTLRQSVVCYHWCFLKGRSTHTFWACRNLLCGCGVEAEEAGGKQGKAEWFCLYDR